MVEERNPRSYAFSLMSARRAVACAAGSVALALCVCLSYGTRTHHAGMRLVTHCGICQTSAQLAARQHRREGGRQARGSGFAPLALPPNLVGSAHWRGGRVMHDEAQWRVLLRLRAPSLHVAGRGWTGCGPGYVNAPAPCASARSATSSTDACSRAAAEAERTHATHAACLNGLNCCAGVGRRPPPCAAASTPYGRIGFIVLCYALTPAHYYHSPWTTSVRNVGCRRADRGSSRQPQMRRTRQCFRCCSECSHRPQMRREAVLWGCRRADRGSSRQPQKRRSRQCARSCRRADGGSSRRPTDTPSRGSVYWSSARPPPVWVGRAPRAMCGSC
jgi:hypothetical protein